MSQNTLKSHCQSIRDILFENINRPVPLPVISDRTMRECETQCYVVHSRINDLREKLYPEYEIINTKEGRHKSFYTLKKVNK